MRRRRQKLRSAIPAILGITLAACSIAGYNAFDSAAKSDRAAFPSPSAVTRAAPSPTPTARAWNLGELRLFALDLINQDRAAFGLPPVVLGTNPAAQMHADDMLEHRYLGHWWVDGRKPYMVYTELGGDSYAAENAAISTYQWYAAQCESGVSICTVKDPFAVIRNAQHDMMYDDAHADWGHRKNILRPDHRRVNIGIAVSDYFIAFIQHFEGGAATARSRPGINDGTLRISLLLNESDAEVHPAISVFYDPEPTDKTPAQIDALDSYCTGGGFTTTCPGRAFVIYPPPRDGWHYADLAADEVVANRWQRTGNLVEIEADVSVLTAEPGIYTVMVFKKTDGPAEVLISLTADRP